MTSDGSGNLVAAPHVLGTVAILIACAVGYFLSQQDTIAPSLMARNVSITLLIGLVSSMLIDWKKGGFKNLIRVDIVAYFSFYFLTYFEFLFPQTHFDMLVIPIDVLEASQILMLGYGGIAIGRHIKIGPQSLIVIIGQIQMKPRDYSIVFFGSFVLSMLPQWLAVNFNFFQWIEELMQPRFTQSWTRGKLGNFSSLLFELQLLGYIISPLGGVIFSRAKEYGRFTLAMVALCILLVWFVSFAGGTRNILGIQIAGLLGGYFVVQPKIRLLRMATMTLVLGVAFVYFAGLMLEFRGIGLSRFIENWDIRQEMREYAALQENEQEKGYFVDYNLWRFSQMVPAFPGLHNYLGWNVAFVALTKPVPRALWPSKPEDLEIGLEQVIGAQGYTIAVTWVGEAYIAGGPKAVLLTGMLIGIFCAYWNRLAAFTNSPYPLLVFASGFYSVLLLMRSLMFFTTSLLPSIALIAAGLLFFRKKSTDELENSQ